MKLYPASFRVPGKWVLAGEHSVLRGADAVALPHPEYALELVYEPYGDPQGAELETGTLEIDAPGAEIVLRELLDEACKRLGLQTVEGRVVLRSTIPLGAGLGSSGALCVAITRWLGGAAGLEEARWFEFARSLEDRFHGRSSGMDVAVVLAGTPIRFNRDSGARFLSVTRLPSFTFHDTGRRARTIDCVAQVQNFERLQPDAAREVDKRMNEASGQAVEGLLAYGAGEGLSGLKLLSEAMDTGHSCFRAWGLVLPETDRLQAELKNRGALSVKLTGAGKGGFLVALWPDPSPTLDSASSQPV